jgi:hypothetical protein
MMYCHFETCCAVLPHMLYCSDYFLVPSNYKGVDNVLVKRFGELLRKLWNSRNFKGQVGGTFG